MKKSSKLGLKSSTIYKYVIPWYLLFVFTLVLPIIVCFRISFFQWAGGPNMKFIGLRNYMDLFKDKTFWFSITNNLKLIIYMVIFQVGFAFILSMVYSSQAVKFKEVHRKIIFLPTILSSVVVGMVWQLIFRQDIGIIASIFKLVGLGNHIIPWLDSSKYALKSISIVLVWQFVGNYVVIIMASMQNINTSILEAAELDGATPFQKSIYIIIPLLKSTMFVILIMVISGCMKMFDIVYVMTNGGPGNATMVAVLYSYNKAFKSQMLGYSSASAILVVIISTMIVIVFKKLFGRLQDE